jgi:hypothetical protein
VPRGRNPFPLVTSVAVEATHGLALLCTGQGYRRWTQQASLLREGRLRQECIENVSKISKSQQPQ